MKMVYPYKDGEYVSGLRLKMCDDTICTHCVRCYSIHCFEWILVLMLLFLRFFCCFFVSLFFIRLPHNTYVHNVYLCSLFAFDHYFHRWTWFVLYASAYITTTETKIFMQRKFHGRKHLSICSLTIYSIVSHIITHISIFNIQYAIVKKAYMQQQNMERRDISLYGQREKENYLFIQNREKCTEHTGHRSTQWLLLPISQPLVNLLRFHG